MTRHNDLLSMQHMLDHAREVVQFAAGKVRSDLDADRLLALGLTRLLEVIGEAAARVSAPTRATYRDIPWSSIVGLRNRLIHGYDQVDLDILWTIISTDLPPLITQLEQAVAGPSE